PPASWVEPSTSRWQNEISSHELYNSGHLFEAASAHYFATGKRNFLDIALKNADLLAANFGPGKLHRPPGHQIVETGLVKLYQITNNKKYLELAKYFLDLRGDSVSHPLYGDYNQDHLPVTRQDEAVGHAVRAEYMYAGMTDIAVLYRDSSYMNAVNAIWENIVDKKLYITGGVGARHEGEAFGNNYELPNLTSYNETCASIGSVYWNQRLFLLTGDSKYYDVIERTLYNGLISGISVDGNKFFYPNPLASDRKYKFNMGSLTRQGWFDCSCCPTNLIRFIPSIPGLVYATHQDSVYINLYMSNTARLTVNGTGVDVEQHTEYPLDGRITIALNPEKPTPMTVKLRIPGWARNKPTPGALYEYTETNTEPISIAINGATQPLKVDEGYVALSRLWTKGDKIELTIPMKVRHVTADARVQDDRNRTAVEYGPIVYCAEEIDNDSLVSKICIPDDAKLNVARQQLLSNDVNVITGTVKTGAAVPAGTQAGNDSTAVRLIPYYLWSNRGVGMMNVWFPRTSE
ncbi:MAG TPA: beta-L-arabinofuranosidase domain-containing protein, partial [Bacteroidota bacterium]|nr:beta-L-arabinofuranosidase domain-containing protein [Bacteroidota bacterium]